MVLSIELDNNIWAFSPGQAISGKVVLTKPIWNKVEGLKLRIYGTIQPGNKPYLPVVPEFKDASIHCVLDYTIIVLENWKVLKPGRHEFPFTYQLPSDVPSSFEITGGRLDYEFISTLKRPRDSFKVYQTRFFVEENVDLKNYPEFQTPIEFTKNEFTGFMCCRNGPFGIKLKLDKTAYVPGEYVNFEAQIDNQSRADLSNIKFIVSREFKLHKGKKFRSKENVSEIVGPVVLSGESKILSGNLLKIPNIPKTNINCRNTFQINYFFKILLQPSPNNRRRIYEKFELIIGSIAVQNDELPLSSNDYHNIMLDRENDNVAQYSGPPPAYDDVVCDDEDIIQRIHYVDVHPIGAALEDFSPSAPLVDNFECKSNM